ncbi:helix-turn-helix domain-containing protein [Neptunicoccus cionae]|uniref:helix-turn-helix domain-containing protein n=1 Tax=Neptunicoccus cionae TaxID=2035344 RepID=UPI000C7941CA|nr:XRE family transcriptional regulator [Amylibacter cionae]PLS21426.1 XRE family transcriptional regulator [Amylibacter cionae]
MATGKPEIPLENKRAAFGAMVQTLRRSQNLTLQQVSDASGLAVSTISKIENSHLSPTYDVMLKLAQGLGTDIVSILDGASAMEPKPSPLGRLAVCRKDDLPDLDAGHYLFNPIATQLKNRLIDATYATVRAREFSEFKAPIRHAGEELVIVLSGAVDLYTDLYEPIRLNAGDSVYYDAVMAHCYVSVSEEDAVILNIVSGASMDKEYLNAKS